MRGNADKHNRANLVAWKLIFFLHFVQKAWRID